MKQINRKLVLLSVPLAFAMLLITLITYFHFYSNVSVVVSKNGRGDFTTISDAIASTTNGDTIIIMAGVYEESVHMWGKERHLIGANRDSCVLTNGTGNYISPPLEMNIGSIRNLSIIADNYAPTIRNPAIDNKSIPCYAVHVEFGNKESYLLEIENCVIESKWNSAIGLGVRYNQTVIISNCDLKTECERTWSMSLNRWVSQGAVYLHNDACSFNSGVGSLKILNCRMHGRKAAVSVFCLNDCPFLEVEFSNNILTIDDSNNGQLIYRREQPVTKGNFAGSKIRLSHLSHGNNICELNKDE